ncbi:hypothetical protein ACFPT7_14750 [Acidicapsa dinghuensis]|uniref:Uncharacterized protein n=1 Tax=Acidicapsa dinghuensis TaxID=2218256 RepID=A0ABW1EKR9_9BACT|nr:hypothetical protein [Acidicapsa dinghuensis]
MTHSLVTLFDLDPFRTSGAGSLFLFLSVLMICIFTMVSIAIWTEARRKEREAYYKAETMRRLAESSNDAAKYALEMMREEQVAQSRDFVREDLKRREGLKIGGLVNIGIGIGLFFLMKDVGGPPMVGALVLGIGVALAIYGFLLAPRHEDR